MVNLRYKGKAVRTPWEMRELLEILHDHVKNATTSEHIFNVACAVCNENKMCWHCFALSKLMKEYIVAIKQTYF
jgi:hypothetical protein